MKQRLILAQCIAAPSCDPADTDAQEKPADNTGNNARDRNGDTKTGWSR